MAFFHALLVVEIELPDIEWKELVILSVPSRSDFDFDLWLVFLKSTQNDPSQTKFHTQADFFRGHLLGILSAVLCVNRVQEVKLALG